MRGQLYTQILKDFYKIRILHLWSKMYQSISKCYQTRKETSQMVNLLSGDEDGEQSTGVDNKDDEGR